MIDFNTIVTGTGRCGTGYFSTLLNSMGLPCGHESVFNASGLDVAKNRILGNEPIVVSCTCGELESCSETCMSVILKSLDKKNIVADSSYLAAPFLDDIFFKDFNFIHILRNPLQVMKSFVQVAGYFDNKMGKETVPFQNFIKKHLNLVYENDFNQADRAYLYYVGWNKMIAEKIKDKRSIVYKMEEDDENKILNFLNKKDCDFSLKNLKINHWENKNQKDLEFKIFKKDFDDLMEQYVSGDFSFLKSGLNKLRIFL